MSINNQNFYPAPLVSIIITCYNYAHFLTEAVESVLNQTFQNYEIIIVNDGSTDNSQIVIEEISEKYKERNITQIHQPNAGVASARNSGISKAKGKYLLCLDADDLIEPTMIEECVQVLENYPAVSIVYTDRKDFGEINKIVEADDYDFKKLLHQNQISYCALFRREVWESIGGYSENIKNAPDWDFWITAGSRGFSAYKIPKPLFKYRRHTKGLFTQTREEFPKIRAQIILNNKEIYPKSDISTALKILERNKTPKSGPYPKVTIVVPTYNRPTMLTKALESVFKQAYEDFEVIVVNDGDIDVDDIIRGFNRDDKILYIKNDTTRGPAYTRNKALYWASGEYICYLDDDDVYYPEHLETLVNYLEVNQVDAAYTDAYRSYQVFESGKYNVKNKELRYSQDFDYDQILINNFIPILCLIHKRQCLDEIGYFDGALTTHEDWDFLIRLSRKYKIHHINKITAEYSWRIDKYSLTRDKQSDYYKILSYIYDKYSNYSKDNPKVVEAQQKNLQLENNRTLPNFLSQEIIISFSRGFYQDEGGWRWMSDEAVINIYPHKKGNKRILIFDVTCSEGKYYKYFPFNFYVFVGDKKMANINFRSSNQTKRIFIKLPLSKNNYIIRLVSESSFSPVLLGISKDVRRLSVCISNISLLKKNNFAKNIIKYIKFSSKQLFS